MTWAVHNLHTAPVEVIENGAARFYRVSSTGAELPLGQFLGDLHATRKEALAWQADQLAAIEDNIADRRIRNGQDQ